MVICCDTSFLFSVYGNDANTSQAHGHLKKVHSSIAVSAFNGFELSNALRLAEFRHLIAAGDAERLISQYRQDISDERIIECPCNLAEILKKAHLISVVHTSKGGHRGFDILQVAAALEMGATDFLTFDRLQAKLAHTMKMKTPMKIARGTAD
jgi:predicted nucleic acid-binding protein